MKLWASAVGELKRRLISLLVSVDGLAAPLIEELIRSNPGQVVGLLADRLDDGGFKGSLMERMATSSGDRLIQLLPEAKQHEVLEWMCDKRLPDVVAAVNARAEGTFRYVAGGNVRVIVGAGPQRQPGWLATDISQLNIVEESSWRRLFDPGSVARVLAEHVLEHLSLRELQEALGNVYRYLQPGGSIRLAVPDAFHPSRYYYNLVKPGGLETPFEHLTFLDHELLSRMAGEAGFGIRLLEYFDGSGIFHRTDYATDDGVIQRCAKNNAGLDTGDPIVMAQFYESIPAHLRQQFTDQGITYTSLIADLVKPD